MLPVGATCPRQTSRTRNAESMNRLSRRSFLAASAAWRQGRRSARRARSRTRPEPSRARRRRRRGRRRRRRRHRGGAADLPRPASASCCRGGRTRSADAASPTPRPSACPTTAARTGSTSPEINPVARLAPQTGLDIYPAPPGQRMRIGRRYAREGEMEDFLAALVRANRAIADAARAGPTSPARRRCRRISANGARPSSSCWARIGCGKELAEISAVDFARVGRARQRRLLPAGPRRAAGEARRRPAGAAGDAGDAHRLGGPRGRRGRDRRRARSTRAPSSSRFRPTCSPPARSSSRPTCPSAHLDAIEQAQARQLRPRGAGTDRQSARAAARRAGVREIGERAHRRDLRQHVGLDALHGRRRRPVRARAVRQGRSRDGRRSRSTGSPGSTAPTSSAPSSARHATRWNHEPWVLGAMSAAAPGAQPSRSVLMEPLNSRIFLAGEAAHETLWGTVGGAWESGERRRRSARWLRRRIGRSAEPSSAAQPG